MGRTDEQSDSQFTALQHLMSTTISQHESDHELTDKTQIVYTLPYSTQPLYGTLFKQLESNLHEYGLTSMGVVSGTLDEVFFKLGGEDTEVYDSSDLAVDMSQYMYPTGALITTDNIGSNNLENTSIYVLFERLVSQIKAIANRKIAHAKKDQYTSFLVTPIILFSFLASLLYQALLIPPGFQIPVGNATATTNSMYSMFAVSSIVTPHTWMAAHQSSYSPPPSTHSFESVRSADSVWVFSSMQTSTRGLTAVDGNDGNVTITDDAVIKLLQHAPPTLIADAFTIFMFYIMFLSIPGVTGEFIVRERTDKLRSLLAVESCTSLAYWLGTLLGDLSILSMPLLVSATHSHDIKILSWF